jgi:putative two-component system response regulator
MQEVLETIRNLKSLQGDPMSPTVHGLLELLRESISARLKAASQADATFFRGVVQALVGLPENIAPEICVELILDVAQYFYFAGLPFDAIEPLRKAEILAIASNQLALVHRAANTLGVIYADTGNLAKAIEKYSQALEIAQQLHDIAAETKTWSNLGVALYYCGDYENSVACYRRVIEMAQDDPLLKAHKITALSNIALSSLHSEDYSRGLRAARRALAEVDEPQTAAQMVSRVLLEKNTARLLIETKEEGDIEEAKLHVDKAKHYAALSKSPRAELEASIAEGLYLVHNGIYDLGLSRLTGALEKARFVKSALRDVLVALVRAYELMGQPDRALIYLRELMEHTKKFQQDNTLRYLRLQLTKSDSDAHDDERPTKTLMRHEEALRGKVAEQELFKARTEILERLAVTAELRDDSTGEHSYRVGKLASLLAAEYNCDEDTIFMIDLAGRLHDIGKVGVPDAILLKPAKLNAAEQAIMRTHTVVGAELLSKSNIPQMQMAEEIARAHHEWWDGSGYPGILSGTGIPLAARITALADVYDALTHKRPYKLAWPIDAAIDQIAALKGRQFDPELTDLFLVLITRLRREQKNLDLFLGQAARESPFLQARAKINDALKRGHDGGSGSSNSRLDTQR